MRVLPTQIAAQDSKWSRITFLEPINQTLKHKSNWSEIAPIFKYKSLISAIGPLNFVKLVLNESSLGPTWHFG